MIRSSNIRKTSVSELMPGDLFRFSFGAGAVLALFLERPDGKPAIVGVLKGAGFESTMIWLELENERRECLSYGSDWFIEEQHGLETFCGERESRGRAGLCIDDPGLIMLFDTASGGGFGFPFAFDIQSNVPAKLTSGAAPILNWKIWENADHRDSGNAPLFERVSAS